MTPKPESTEGQDITLGMLGTDRGAAPKAELFANYQAHQSQQTTDRSAECTNTPVRSKATSFRIESGSDTPSNSKVGFQSTGNSSRTKSHNVSQQEGHSSAEKTSTTKSHQHFPNPGKSASGKLTDVKQRSSSSSPEKAKIPSRLHHQQSKPSSRSDDKVSLIPERVCHRPVF